MQIKCVNFKTLIGFACNFVFDFVPLKLLILSTYKILFQSILVLVLHKKKELNFPVAAHDCYQINNFMSRQK